MRCLEHWFTLRKKKSEDLYTNIYVVPPTFGNQDLGAARDPFADAAPLPKRTPAKEVLEAAGVFFPEGGSAIYNPKVSQLIVRTTKEQMELVEVYIDSIVGGVEKQIFVKVFFIEVNEPLWEGLEQPHVEGDKISEFSAFLPESDLPASKMMELLAAPYLKAAVKKEAGAMRSQNFKNAMAQPAGVFSDPQLEVFLESKEKAKGFKKVVAPSGVSRSGQRAFIQVGDRAVVVDPVIGADNFTVDLDLTSRQTAKSRRGGRQVEHRTTTIWDGQTFGLVEKTEGKKFIYTLVRAKIVDPAGMPINEQPKGIPEKE